MVREVAVTQRRWRALLGLPVTGLLWSLATLHAKSDQVAMLGISQIEAVFIVSLGGVAQALAMWIGFSVVVWAMIRAFGGRPPLLLVAILVSSAALPLWVGAPAVAYWLAAGTSGNPLALLVALGALALFLLVLAQALADELVFWSYPRVIGAIAAAVIFLSSFTYLFI